MSAPSEIPNDENGVILKRLRDAGDMLTEPRMVDFCFIFAERRQAIAFVEIVDDRNLVLCISYYEARDMWQANAKRYMVPNHADITATELTLTHQAETVGGAADGWGCMSIKNAPTT